LRTLQTIVIGSANQRYSVFDLANITMVQPYNVFVNEIITTSNIYQ